MAFFPRHNSTRGQGCNGFSPRLGSPSQHDFRTVSYQTADHGTGNPTGTQNQSALAFERPATGVVFQTRQNAVENGVVIGIAGRKGPIFSQKKRVG